ncbi:MAG TPA: CPBP family intramembrane glutamic endopeptidase [Fimbriiglobus sp.]|jgi:membrane protease YdiL (CAAX protease family)
MIRRWWQKLIGETIANVEWTARADTADTPVGIDRKSAAVLVTAAVCLMVQNFTQSLNSLADLVDRMVGMVDESTASIWRDDLLRLSDSPTNRWGWWGVITTLTYFVIPAVVVKVGFRERLSDYGLKIKGIFSAWPLYVGMLAIMVPIIWLVSHSQRFLLTYPMYGADWGGRLDRSSYLFFELVYALQFCTLEFFFRGFLVHGTKHRFGVGSVFVMMVPYCMIHFQKPFPECCGSIVAGFALGLISLKTRSIWLGAALHISVAWTMDGFALYRKGVTIG